MRCSRLVILISLAATLMCNNLLFAQVAGTLNIHDSVYASAVIQAKNLPNKNQINNNILKINVPALFFKNFSVQYERKIKRKTSFAVAVRLRPEANLPFQKKVEDLIDAPSIRVDLFKAGHIGITPEYRFYLSKKGAMNGFYIGPFISYTHYTGNVPVNYYDYVNNVTIDKVAGFRGSANTFTAGFEAGAQWRLSDKVYLDWWIAGPNYGFCNGNFVYKGSLNDIERISLQYKLEEVQYTIPLVNIGFPDGHPNANGASFNVTGPWVGIRALGINLGYRF